MTKNKKPWYIWFSILAIIFLWGDTSRRIKFSGKNMGLWTRAVGNIAKLSVFYIILPLLLFGALIDRLVMRNVSIGSLSYELGVFAVLFIVYFFGVYATYRHSVWRKENISHLLKNDSQQSDNDEPNNL